MAWSFMYLILLMSMATPLGAVTVEKYSLNIPQQDLDQLQEILSMVNDFFQGVYNFWISYGHDEEFGGFYTFIDHLGVPDPQQPKNIIMQSDHLYVAAALLLHEQYPEEDKEKIIELMHAQYDWIKEHLATPYNKEFSYIVSADGKTVLDGEYRMYYTNQAIWGLAHYSMAAKMLGETDRAEESLQMALDAYQSLHERLYDTEYGGYIQSREANWFLEFGMSAYGSPLNWAGGCKGFNSHMHMIEGLTSLYLASGDSFIRDMLQELIHLYMTKQYEGDKPFQNMVMYCNWTGYSNHDVAYPQDMQTTHLLMDAGEALNYVNISKEDIDKKVVQIAKNVQFYAFDKVNGGIFKQGVDQLGVTNFEKAFWAQVESALGFWRAYLVSGDSTFLETLKSTLVFYRDFMQADIGEFYQDYKLYQGGINDLNIYTNWKAAYHNSRCMLIMIEEIKSFLG
eukprot:TRINITY_DN1146_c0_g1_i2.p1 TRINITY_DN1146_c0_g1~~TRINITY_DN1146_c0_g1_i2.p1  ORF type:complete len:482 (-),score=36.37 TRINITY_DN1146_c0_g1_i2:319-1677(-)